MAYVVSTRSMQDIMRSNLDLLLRLITLVTLSPGPHEPSFYDAVANQILSDLFRDLNPTTYRRRNIEFGGELFMTRFEDGWNVEDLLSLLVKHDLLATRRVHRRELTQAKEYLERGTMSAQWRLAVDFGKEHRGWQPRLPFHFGCEVGMEGTEEERALDAEAIADESNISYEVEEAGLRFIDCRFCDQRVFFNQVELHPRHQQALLAILAVDINRAVDEAVLATGALGGHDHDFVDGRWRRLWL